MGCKTQTNGIKFVGAYSDYETIPATGVITTIDLEFKATDNIDPQLDCDVFVDSVLNQSVTADNGVHTTVGIDVVARPDAYTFKVACCDDFNNCATTNDLHLIVADTEAPKVVWDFI